MCSGVLIGLNVFGVLSFSFVFALVIFLCWGAGEAIWDKPDVVAGREAHARALEKRYAGLPEPLLLHVRTSLPPIPPRY